MTLRELARRILAGEMPTCNKPSCEHQEMFPADGLVRMVRCPCCGCEVPMQPEWDHLDLKRAAYVELFNGSSAPRFERLARTAMVLCVMREVGRPTNEARVNLAEALAMTEPDDGTGCDHTPGIPTPNRPNAATSCRKCGRLLNLQPPSV